LCVAGKAETISFSKETNGGLVCVQVSLSQFGLLL